MKALRILLTMGILTVLVAGLVAAQTLPTVEYKGFDPVTFKYTYQVTTTSFDTYSFAYLEVFTKVANEGLTGNWVMDGPFVGANNLQWTTRWETYDNIGDPTNGISRFDAATWYTMNPINPSAWVGTFTLIAPNTSPTGFVGITMGAEMGSDGFFETTVPGPAAMIPEPSSLLALGSGLMGLGGIFIRRRKA